MKIENVVRESLDVVILALLSKRSMREFDVVKIIAENFEVVLSQGTVYSRLRSMEDRGYIESKRGKNEKKGEVYFLTSSGKKLLEESLREYKDFLRQMLDLVEGTGKGR
jgi:DNA-binding PadR family transcriptional regulator